MVTSGDFDRDRRIDPLAGAIELVADPGATHGVAFSTVIRAIQP